LRLGLSSLIKKHFINETVKLVLALFLDGKILLCLILKRSEIKLRRFEVILTALSSRNTKIMVGMLICSMKGVIIY